MPGELGLARAIAGNKSEAAKVKRRFEVIIVCSQKVSTSHLRGGDGEVEYLSFLLLYRLEYPVKLIARLYYETYSRKNF